MGWVLGKKYLLICFSSMFMNSNSKYLFCLLHWLTTLTSSLWVAPQWNCLLEKEDHFYIYQIQGPAGFPGLQDIVCQNGHWQFYDTSQEKNVIWRERQLLLVQHIGFLHWCHTLCNCVLKCAKLCKILQNFAQLHCLCISAEPMGSLKKPKGGIANDNSIGSLVFCPLDASS